MAITAEMLEVLTSSITDNLAVILPIAISGFGILFGVRLVPKVFKMFVK